MALSLKLRNGLLLKNNVINPEALEDRIQNAAFIRLKNLQMEYSFSLRIVLL